MEHILKHDILLNEGFYKHNYDIIFNTNLDDYYSLNRFNDQLECINNVISYVLVL